MRSNEALTARAESSAIRPGQDDPWSGEGERSPDVASSDAASPADGQPPGPQANVVSSPRAR